MRLSIGRTAPYSDVRAQIISAIADSPGVVAVFGEDAPQRVSSWLPEEGGRESYPRVLIGEISLSDAGNYTHWAFEGTVSISIYSDAGSSFSEVERISGAIRGISEKELSNEKVGFTYFRAASISESIGPNGLTSVLSGDYNIRVSQP